MGKWITERVNAFILFLILSGIFLGPGWVNRGIALADQKSEPAAPQEVDDRATSGETAEYHTPLAGDPLHTVFMGKSVDIPAKDRSRVFALTLGEVFYTPKQGDTSATPIGSLPDRQRHRK